MGAIRTGCLHLCARYTGYIDHSRAFPAAHLGVSSSTPAPFPPPFFLASNPHSLNQCTASTFSSLLPSHYLSDAHNSTPSSILIKPTNCLCVYLGLSRLDKGGSASLDIAGYWPPQSKVCCGGKI